MTECGRCHTEITDGKYRNSMHYGKIHNKCHDKMFADISINRDEIRINIIKERENKISFLEKKRDNITAEIENQKEYLNAFKKTGGVVLH